MSAWAIAAAAAASAAGALSGQNMSRRNMKTDHAWKQRMRETAYQTTMGDMKAAGLNPMLAYMKGSTSMPSGSSATGGQDAGTPAVSSAISAYMASQQGKLVHENVEKTKEETEALRISNKIQRGHGTSIPGRIWDTAGKASSALGKYFENKEQTKAREKAGTYRDKKGVLRHKKGKKKVDPLAERFKRNRSSKAHKLWDKFWKRKKGHHD